MKAAKTLAAIDAALEASQEREHRAHLGASILGKKCLRAVFYSWRWAKLETFKGRMLRLFERGHLEEPRFFKHLEAIGCKVWPVDPNTGKQWRISFAMGHGGGSADGVACGIPDLPPETPFLVECKTHGDDSFKELEKEGICQSKPEHFAQAQIYTVKLGLPASLYMGVNKNTDALHLELLTPNPGFVATLIQRAEDVVCANLPPPKINKSPGFYICKWCKFHGICHGSELPERNCRTCEFSKAEEGGVWRCIKYDWPLTREQQATGCRDYMMKSGFKDA